MMIIVFVIFNLKSLFCQPVFTNDTSFINNPTFFDKKIDSIFKPDKDNIFELKFSDVSIRRNRQELLILSLKNNTWTARYFIENGFQNSLVEVNIDQAKISDCWDILLKNDILNIPKEEDLRDSSGNELRDNIADGILYDFRLISKNNKRRFVYHCPKLC